MRIPTSDETWGSGPAILYEFLSASSLPSLCRSGSRPAARGPPLHARSRARSTLWYVTRVAGHRERLARRQLPLDDGVVGARAGDPDREQHDRDMHDVPAVAAPVAPDQRGEGDGPDSCESARRARVPRTNSSPIAARTNAENVYAISPGIDEPAPSAEEHDAGDDATAKGHRKVRPRPRTEARRQATRARRPSAGATGGRRSAGRSRSRDGRRRPIAPPHCLREDRPRHAPENRQAERDEEQVVVKEQRLARDERLESRGRAEQREPPHDQRRREDHRDHDEARNQARCRSARTSGSS